MIVISIIFFIAIIAIVGIIIFRNKGNGFTTNSDDYAVIEEINDSKSRQKAQESLKELFAQYKEDMNIDFDSDKLIVEGYDGPQELTGDEGLTTISKTEEPIKFYKNYLF